MHWRYIVSMEAFAYSTVMFRVSALQSTLLAICEKACDEFKRRLQPRQYLNSAQLVL